MSKLIVLPESVTRRICLSVKETLCPARANSIITILSCELEVYIDYKTPSIKMCFLSIHVCVFTEIDIYFQVSYFNVINIIKSENVIFINVRLSWNVE